MTNEQEEALREFFSIFFADAIICSLLVQTCWTEIRATAIRMVMEASHRARCEKQLRSWKAFDRNNFWRTTAAREMLKEHVGKAQRKVSLRKKTLTSTSETAAYGFRLNFSPLTPPRMASSGARLEIKNKKKRERLETWLQNEHINGICTGKKSTELVE